MGVVGVAKPLLCFFLDLLYIWTEHLALVRIFRNGNEWACCSWVISGNGPLDVAFFSVHADVGSLITNMQTAVLLLCRENGLPRFRLMECGSRVEGTMKRNFLEEIDLFCFPPNRYRLTQSLLRVKGITLVMPRCL